MTPEETQRKAYFRNYYLKNRDKALDYGRERYKRDPEKFKTAARRRYSENPDKQREYDLKRKFGIDLEKRNAILAAQNGVCAICKVTPKGNRAWPVDHCHKTNKIRGVLCASCNSGLGHFRDNPEFLAAAIEYLQT